MYDAVSLLDNEPVVMSGHANLPQRGHTGLALSAAPTLCQERPWQARLQSK